MQARSDLAKLHSAPFPQGMHCGARGAFVDNVPLLRQVPGKFGHQNFTPRNPDALSLDLHAEMSRKSEELGGQSLRDSLRGKSVADQLKAMFELMKKLRILK
jgi:hypothetical protein